jgi:hypothetical protein
MWYICSLNGATISTQKTLNKRKTTVIVNNDSNKINNTDLSVDIQ